LLQTSKPGATGTADGEMVAIKKQLKSCRHGAGLQVPLPSKQEASTLRIGIVRTCWHEELIELLVSKTIDQMVFRGVKAENIVQAVVPGSYELPYITKRMLDSEDVDVVVCVGILLKGGTIHMEVIADAVTNQLMGMQMSHSIPIIFGVLTVLAIEQAVERAESELPASWGDSALTMAMHKRKLRTVGAE
jgi:6,7-dimethyl-8-ribityllumazine synthase